MILLIVKSKTPVITTIFTILGLIFINPVGLILMFFVTKWPTVIKIIILVICIPYYIVVASFIFRYINDRNMSSQNECRAICVATETAKSPERDKTLILNQCKAECSINQKLLTP